MTFLAPERLLLLVLVAALAAGYVVLQRTRRHHAVRFTNLDLLDSVAPQRPGWRRHVAAGIAGLALVSMVIALARPAHDARVPREEAVVMLAIDVSRSMTATDVTPSRLASAVTAAKSFIDGVPAGFRVGLVAFDDNARLVETPTLDHQAVLDALDRLQPGRGTAAGDAIETALDAIRSSSSTAGTSATGTKLAATIVLLSDGATTAGTDPAVASQDATSSGVPVTTIAYGTAQGTVTVDGEVVPVPADPVAMKSIADATKGSFFEASSASRLREVYRDIRSRIGHVTEQREIVLWFVFLALIALMLALGASMLWTARFI
ncbi:MAG: Ca-activated chloride channel [Actinomycetota bacterium]|jgi:Ca-activated chloride channel family protein|nr:Ca-activated chloride channel [Actinomycetota bacterium]